MQIRHAHRIRLGKRQGVEHPKLALLDFKHMLLVFFEMGGAPCGRENVLRQVRFIEMDRPIRRRVTKQYGRIHVGMIVYIKSC